MGLCVMDIVTRPRQVRWGAKQEGVAGLTGESMINNSCDNQLSGDRCPKSSENRREMSYRALVTYIQGFENTYRVEW